MKSRKARNRRALTLKHPELRISGAISDAGISRSAS